MSTHRSECCALFEKLDARRQRQINNAKPLQEAAESCFEFTEDMSPERMQSVQQHVKTKCRVLVVPQLATPAALGR